MLLRMTLPDAQTRAAMLEHSVEASYVRLDSMPRAEQTSG
jgi:hypothetical protein